MMMNFFHLPRRILLIASVLILLPWPAVAAPQVVGVILTGNLPRYREAHNAFVNVLETGGFGAAKVKIFVQTPNADKMSLVNAVRRAVAAGAEIVVTYGTPATMIARDEAKKVPILFADVYDPVGAGLVKSLAAPGVEVTGASCNVPLESLIGKLLRVRQIKSVGVLFTASDKGSAQQVRELESLAGKNGFSVQKQDIGNEEKVGPAVDSLLNGVDAIYLTESVPVGQRLAEVIEKAKGRVPVVSQIPGLGERGAVLNLEADPEEQGKLLAVHTLQVLSGQKAFMLPVRLPKKISLVVNKGAARQLSMALPDEILKEAGRIVE